MDVSYWKWVESWARVDRERAFRQWRDSGYSDFTAHTRFIDAYVRANNAAWHISRPKRYYVS